MKAYRAKTRIRTACSAVVGAVREIPPDGPGDFDEDRRAVIM